MPRKPKPPVKGHATATRKTTAKSKATPKATGKAKSGAKAKPAAKSKAAPVTEREGAEFTDKPKRGRPTKYRPEYAEIARQMCRNGATDYELAQEFGVVTSTIWCWQSKFPEFSNALKVEKGEYDDRIERALAQRALGYSYDAEKQFHFQGIITRAQYVEHVPPDPGAAKIWLCNRRPDVWRDKQTVEHGLTSDLAALLGAIDGHGASIV